MPSPNLPLELIQHILDQVDPTFKYHTWKACSLISSDWTFAAQQHLFSRVTVSPTSRSRSFLSLVAQGHPNAIYLTQHLRILVLKQPLTVDPRRSRFPIINGGQSSRYRQAEYGGTPHRMISFLNQLKALQELTLHLPEVSWRRMGNPTNEAIIRLFQLPTMKKILLEFSGTIPVGLLFTFGGNVQEVAVMSKLSSRKSQHQQALALTGSNERRVGPEILDLHLGDSSNLGVLMSHPFRKERPTLFTSLRSVTYDYEILNSRLRYDMDHLHMLLNCCRHLSTFKIEGSGYSLNFQVHDYRTPFDIKETPTRTPHSYGVTLLISHTRPRDTSLALQEITYELLHKPLPATHLCNESPESHPPTIIPDRLLSDVLTSLDLSHEVKEPANSDVLDYNASAMYGQMWRHMDEYFNRSLPVLRTLSVNVWAYVLISVDKAQFEQSITFGAEKHFPIMSIKLQDRSKGGWSSWGRAFESKFTGRYYGSG